VTGSGGGSAAASAPFAVTSAVTSPVPIVTGRIGILGGTFDPIHHGHLAIADVARESLGFERVVLVPAARPPHKPAGAVAPAGDRLAMVELAVAGLDGFDVSRIEIDRGGPSYAVETVEAMAAEAIAAGHDPDLWFILSEDAVRGLPEWRTPERLLARCRLAVLPRDGVNPPDAAWFADRFPGLDDRIVRLDAPRVGISASDIRARRTAGRSIRFLVPEAVERYIVDHGLYASQ
jgi:nicotinate-nucleotide adenylyltransferase